MNPGNPTIYIFINKRLNMSIGKVAAQAAHCAAYTMARNHEQFNDEWLNSAHKTVIVLEAQNENEMRNIKDYLRVRGVNSEFIIDEGANEVTPMSMTALVTEFIDKSQGDTIMNSFKLYNGTSLQHASQAFLESVGARLRRT